VSTLEETSATTSDRCGVGQFTGYFSADDLFVMCVRDCCVHRSGSLVFVSLCQQDFCVLASYITVNQCSQRNVITVLLQEYNAGCACGPSSAHKATSSTSSSQ
jgi:hypothetical protein